MCLATAYKILNCKEEKIGEDITMVEIRPGKVILTDLFGQISVIKGTLLSSDLTKNIIRIIPAPDEHNESIKDIAKYYVNSLDEFAQNNQIVVTEVTSSYAVAQMPITEKTKNSMNIAHGGAIVSLADTVSGVAAVAACSSPCVTVTSNVHFLSKAAEGTLTATAEVLHCGYNTVICKATILDENDTTIAFANFTYTPRPYYVDHLSD